MCFAAISRAFFSSADITNSSKWSRSSAAIIEIIVTSGRVIQKQEVGIFNPFVDFFCRFVVNDLAVDCHGNCNILRFRN